MLRRFAISEYASAERLRRAAHCLLQRFRRRPPLCYYSCQAAYENEPKISELLMIRSLTLPDLACFRIGANPYGNEIAVHIDSSHLMEVERWRPWIITQGPRLPQFSHFVHLRSPGRPDIDLAKSNLLFESDYSLGIYLGNKLKPSHSLCWSVEGELASNEMTRRDFFAQRIAACGLDRDIFIEDDPLGFRVVSETIPLEFSMALHGIHGPHLVKATAPSPEIAWEWLQQALAMESGTPLYFSISWDCSLEHYAEHRAHLNSMHHDWEVHFLGEYRAAFDPFQAELPSGETRLALPLLYWEVGGGSNLYQCDVVVTPFGRRLEIITDTQSTKRLAERIKQANVDLKFRIVDSPTEL